MATVASPAPKYSDDGRSLGVLYTGYLDKKNPAFGGGFHERFVVLTVDSLHWFRRHEGEDLFGEERGHVALAVILTVRSLEQDKTIFEVQSTDGKKRQFKAENVKACEEWVTAIRSAIRLMVDASNFKRYGNRRSSLAGIKNIIEDSENNTDNADSAEVNVLLVSLYSPSHSGNEAVLARRPDWNRVICVPRVAQGDTLLISTSNGGIIKLPYSQLIDKADSGKPFEAALQNVSLASSLQMTVAVETLSLLGGDFADASGGGGDSGGAGGNGKKKSLSQQLMSLGKALTRERDASINLIMSLMVIIASFRTLQAVGVDTSLFFVLAFILSVHNFGAIWKRVHAEDERGAQSQSLRLVLHGHTFTSPDAPIDDPADEIPQRFIDGCEGDMREARRRWDITRHWRETEGINNILREPQPHFNLIKQMYPHYNAGRGKEGNIIFWDRPGECNLAQLAARGVGLPEMVRHFLFNTEYQWEIIEKGSQTSKSIAVLDVKGVSMSDLAGSNLDFVKQTVSIANQHYPERSFAIVVVNAPFFASMAWKIIKPWVHPNTQKKVKILSASETLNGLREIINDDQIPLYYGGSWTCGDGSKDCVRFYAPEVQEQAEYVRRLNEGTLPPPNSAQEESERGEAPPGVAGEAAGSISTAESNVEELGMSEVQRVKATGESTAYVPFSEIFPCVGLCCCICSCYITFPDCIGCVSQETCCCLRVETLLCKPSRSSDACCTFLSALFDCVYCSSFCKCTMQAFCLDFRCAFPTDESEVPCVMAMLFITCYFRDRYVCHCCAKGSALEPTTATSS